MKHLRIYEEYKDSDFKYKVGDYVKFIDVPGVFYIIKEVDKEDIFKPYLLKTIDNLDDEFTFWTGGNEIYQDEETELMQTQNKYNL